MRGRPKKYSIDRTRPTIVKLTGLASVILGEIRKNSKAFDFSKYVSNKLIQDFYQQGKETIIINELNMIQLEQDMMNEKFNNMKKAKAIQLANIKEIRRGEVITCTQ